MRMKNRLSLTIDPKVVRQAKRVAKKRNTSLSALVEQLLAIESSDMVKPEPTKPFSQRWKGKLKIASKNETRFKKLAAKHQLK